MSELIYKKHNVSVLFYRLVCPTKYRKAVLTPHIDAKLKKIWEEISLRPEQLRVFESYNWQLPGAFSDVVSSKV